MIIDATAQSDILELMDELRIHVKGVSPEIGKHYLIQATRDFIKKTNVSTRQIPITIQPCVTEYPVIFHECVEMVRVLSVQDGNCNNRTFRVKLPALLELICYPSGGDTCGNAVATVVVVPTKDACTIDSAVLDAYSDAIIYGAAYRLLMQKSASWYDVAQSVTLKREYLSEVRTAKRDRFIGYSPFSATTKRLGRLL